MLVWSSLLTNKRTPKKPKSREVPTDNHSKRQESLAAAKWYSTKELEYYVRNTWHDEYIRLSREFECADSKLATVRRLLDSLSDLKYNLGRICKNIETEMANTRVPDGYEGY